MEMTNNTIPNVPRELLERAATSIEQRMCIQCEGVPCCMPESLNTLSDIRALLSTPSSANHVEDVRTMVVPEGYKLVPIEPTAAQCFTAAFNLCNEFGDEFVRDNKQFALAAYRSLVAASQSAKGGE